MFYIKVTSHGGFLTTDIHCQKFHFNIALLQWAAGKLNCKVAPYCIGNKCAEFKCNIASNFEETLHQDPVHSCTNISLKNVAPLPLNSVHLSPPQIGAMLHLHFYATH